MKQIVYLAPMDYGYQTLMEGKSEADLRKYITDAVKYHVEAIEAAVNELQKRGAVLKESELQKLQEVKQQKAVEPTFTQPVENIQVAAPVANTNTPEYYSELAIWTFSILFTTLAGAILLVANLRRSGKKEGIAPTLTFGILYTIFIGIVASILNQKGHTTSGIAIFFNAPGALVLTQMLWKKYMGADVEYQKRSVLAPALIWLTICGALVGLAWYLNTLA